MSATAANLRTAYARSCADHARYQFFAKAAKKDGYVQISLVFAELAEHEKTHAKRFLKLISEAGSDGAAALLALPLEAIGTTAENLRSAAAGEAYEHAELYPAFAQDAKGDGQSKAAAQFTTLMKAAAHHEAMLTSLADLVESGNFFSREEKVTWQCLHCGFTHTAKAAPPMCPACDHPQAHFALAAPAW